ncbi:hypothetical protein [Staphylococcus epidermidis]|uniref:hypothetical protein n=1 Tax=Staphylococcus epidermidis TaxID=1282 RepID=UPI0028583DD9|nr:hypothetical protein [Staphylococcus epidermidis]MDR6744688.1 hypothetical protein [Staphylococcus epidermidis]
MVKIKNKLSLEPKELLKYLLDLEETDFTLYVETEDGYNNLIKPKLKVGNYITYNEEKEAFTIEVEEEIDENTVFPVLVKTLKNAFNEITVVSFENASINSSKSQNETISYHILNDDGTMNLIWKDGKLVD